MQTQKTNKIGRPSKLTESRMEKLIEALRSGNYRIDACRAAGIHYNTLLAWEKKGESQKSGEYIDFLDALRRAEAEAVVSNVKIINKAATGGDWRAAAWFLEHKYPNNWARLDKRAIEDMIPNTSKDVIQERINEYWAERERRGIGSRRIIDIEDTNSGVVLERVIKFLQHNGYAVFDKTELKATEWQDRVDRLHQKLDTSTVSNG
jgi:hemerythrin superfamily protein